jgi:hypothetical protein
MRRRMSIGLALASVLAIGATAARTASAKTLTLSDGGVALAPGYAFEMFGRANVHIHTSVGDIDCLQETKQLRSALLVSVIKNPGFYATPLEVKGTTGPLNGEEQCRTGPTNKWGFANVRLGGGTLRLRASGKATMGHPANLFFRTERDEGFQPLSCHYKTYQLSGSNNATATPEPLNVTLGHKLGLNTAVQNEGRCPKNLELSLFFPSTIDEETEEGRIDEQLTP